MCIQLFFSSRARLFNWIFLSFLLYVRVDAQTDFTAVSQAFYASYEYEYAQNYDEAINVLEKVYSDKQYEIHLRLGWLYYLKGDMQKSIAFYKRAIMIQPKSAEAKLGMAYPLASLSNWDELALLYKNILKDDSRNYTALYRLSLIYYYKKKYSDALSAIQLLLPLYPFDYDCNLLAGKIFIGLGKITDAKKYIQRAVLYNPTATEPAMLLQSL